MICQTSVTWTNAICEENASRDVKCARPMDNSVDFLLPPASHKNATVFSTRQSTLGAQRTVVKPIKLSAKIHNWCQARENIQHRCQAREYVPKPSHGEFVPDSLKRDTVKRPFSNNRALGVVNWNNWQPHTNEKKWELVREKVWIYSAFTANGNRLSNVQARFIMMLKRSKNQIWHKHPRYLFEEMRYLVRPLIELNKVKLTEILTWDKRRICWAWVTGQLLGVHTTARGTKISSHSKERRRMSVL